MSRGLTAERARERKAAGLCPRHDVPAVQPGGLCARCLGKVDFAVRYRVSKETLAAMAAALRPLALALCVACCASCAATNGGGHMPPMVAQTQADRTTLAAPAADSGSYVLEFHMPTVHTLGPLSSWPDSANPLAEGYRRWEIGYSCQSPVWRDSVYVNGPEWGRDLENFVHWRPGAQIRPVMSGWARPGERVTVRPPLVMSLHWPYAWFARSYTSVPSLWSNPTVQRYGN